MVGFPVALVLLCLFLSCQASYEDSRCKCVCVDHSVPKRTNESSTEPARTVFVKPIPADKCTCPFMLENKSELCPYCDCKYQVRNTATIKVVVCLIVVIIAALSLYLIFMVILEPFLSSRGRKITFSTSRTGVQSKTLRASRNYSVASEAGRFSAGARSHQIGYNSMGGVSRLGEGDLRPEDVGVSSVVNRAREYQGKIEAQRDRVFNERTILN